MLLLLWTVLAPSISGSVAECSAVCANRIHINVVSKPCLLLFKRALCSLLEGWLPFCCWKTTISVLQLLCSIRLHPLFYENGLQLLSAAKTKLYHQFRISLAWSLVSPWCWFLLFLSEPFLQLKLFPPKQAPFCVYMPLHNHMRSVLCYQTISDGCMI